MGSVYQPIHFESFHSKAVVLGFFVLLLLIGIGTVRDYGVTWDEGDQRRYGEMVYRYVVENDQQLFSDEMRHYGAIVEFSFHAVQKVLKVHDAQSIYLLRHFLNFLLFCVGAWFFYLLAYEHFRSRMLALVSSVALVLSPVIFAHAFFNTKDMPLMVFFIIGIYTLLHFAQQQSYGTAAWHALATALAMDVRILGIFLLLLTVLAILLQGPAILRRHATILLFYAALSACFAIFFWPTLWQYPWGAFLAAFRIMVHYPWSGSVFYFGQYIHASALPWHYLPVWILISTPILYTALFLIGLGRFLARALAHPRALLSEERNLLLFFCWLFIPLSFIILAQSVVYDSWRHVFFVYPAFVLIAADGLLRCLHRIRHVRVPGAPLILAGAFLACVLYTGIWMVRNHPFQQMYFSVPSAWVNGKFDGDYWGASYKQGYEYILAHDSRDRITVHAANMPGIMNRDALSTAVRERIVLVDSPDQAMYFVTNHRDRYGERYPYHELHSIVVDGRKILTIYATGAR